MTQTIKVSNYAQINVVERTKLAADALAGQAVLTVQNNNNFGVNDTVAIGKIRSERMEKGTVLSVTGADTITLTGNLSFAYDKYTEVTKLFGDQIRIYRASNVDGSAPSDVDFSLLATVQIDFDDLQTTYTDATGSSDYWYKSIYYNSISNSETSLANSSAVRGGGYGNYATLSSIRRQAGLQNNQNIADALIEEKRQAAQRLIDGTLSGLYEVPFRSPINPQIAEMTRKLAAGYLLTQEFGVMSGGRFYKQGMDMIGEVTNEKNTGLLDRLAAKAQVLTSTTGTDLSLDNVGGFSMYPDATTEGNEPENDGARFHEGLRY